MDKVNTNTLVMLLYTIHMQIKLFDHYTLRPFNLTEQYEAYAQIVAANAEYLHSVEMDHIAFYEKGELLVWLQQVENDGLLSMLIYDKEQIIGRISIYKATYDNVDYASLSIFLDQQYHNLGIMTCGLEKFLKHCQELNIQNIMWEAKSINETSNHLAVKLNFKFWKQVLIDPKARNLAWNCQFYNLYLKA